MDLNSMGDGFIWLKFGPRWKYVACTRSFIQNFLAISIEDKTKADKIALAASELLENAVKYTNSETTMILVKVNPSHECIKIEVENESSPEHIEELKKIYNQLKAGTPLEVYVNMMKAAALRQDGKSQLGLARVQFEIGGGLKLAIENRTVKMSIEIG